MDKLIVSVTEEHTIRINDPMQRINMHVHCVMLMIDNRVNASKSEAWMLKVR